jgi:hypothetical protein
MFSQKLISGVLGLSLLSLTATACGTAVGAAAGAIYDITKHNK